MTVKTIVTQFKRELWENKTGFIYTPIVVSLLYLALLLTVSVVVMPQGSKFDFNVGNDQFTFNNDQKGIDQHQGVRGLALLTDTVKKDPTTFTSVLQGAVYINSVFLTLVFIAVMLAYAHSCLFDDRKTRDILFWRSMPVSETTNVLVKLGFLLLAAPLVVLVLNSIIALLVSVSGLLFFIFQGVSIGDLGYAIFHQGAVFLPVSIFVNSLFALLAFLPVSGYILFCSAYARRSPAILSSLIPILLAAADKILAVVFGINIHVNEIISAYGKFLSQVLGQSAAINPAILSNSGSFLLAIAVGSAFVLAAIWLRNHRYEI